MSAAPHGIRGSLNIELAEAITEARLEYGHNGLAQLHADQAACEAARKMRTHLQEHSVEDWLTRYPRRNP